MLGVIMGSGVLCLRQIWDSVLDVVSPAELQIAQSPRWTPHGRSHVDPLLWSMGSLRWENDGESPGKVVFSGVGC